MDKSEETLFGEALEIADAGERAAFLDRNCADRPDVRKRLERLLADATAAGNFLEEPACIAVLPSRRIGETVGRRYVLEEILGEGGMGTVYLASQIMPVKRPVALKIVKPGLVSERMVARFEAERETLALLGHPNIAQVYDGGLADCGSPFFAMELVRGAPITQYCDSAKLSPRRRLELFVPVCQSVHHAHQKGIIHRDLKPSNLLVTERDGLPVPKVIDFGVAKAVGEQAGGPSDFTDVGQIIGTPEYMSPEQARTENADIDTRADIYSLGVVLYELLAGSTPLKRGHDILEVLRSVREDEPPTPSTRLTASEDGDAVAWNRGTAPAELKRLLRGELDWIVMKAIDKDRERRYGSAEDFAADIQRYLADRPVTACPPGRLYRARKFARRNRGAVIAASLLMLALLGGTVGTAWGWVEARRGRAAALREVEEKKKALAFAEEQERKATAALKAEAAARRQARLALYAVTDEILEKVFAKSTDLGEDEKKFLLRVRKLYAAHAAEENDSADGRYLVAYGLFQAGRLNGMLGENREAWEAYQRAIPLFAALASDFPEDPRHPMNLAAAHGNAALALRKLGKAKDAEEHRNQSILLDEALVAKHPGEAKYREKLAIQLHGRGLEFLETRNFKDAEADLRRGLEMQTALVDQSPRIPTHLLHQAKIRMALARLLELQRKPADAGDAYRHAVEAMDHLASEHPGNVEFSQSLGTALCNYGDFLFGRKSDAEAERCFRRAKAIFGKLAGRFPGAPAFAAKLADSCSGLALVLTNTGSPVEAEESYRSALAIQETLVKDYPEDPQYRKNLAGSYVNFGNLVFRRQPSESIEWFTKAMPLLEGNLAANPRSAADRRFLGNAHGSRARAYAALDRHAEALPEWNRAVELDDGGNSTLLRTGRMISLAHAGESAKALADIQFVMAGFKITTGNLFTFARVHALCAAGTNTERAEQAGHIERAMGYLSQAINAGYSDANRMKTDPALAPLRAREDFRKLLERVERAAAAKKKP